MDAENLLKNFLENGDLPETQLSSPTVDQCFRSADDVVEVNPKEDAVPVDPKVDTVPVNPKVDAVPAGNGDVVDVVALLQRLESRISALELRVVNQDAEIRELKEAKPDAKKKKVEWPYLIEAGDLVCKCGKRFAMKAKGSALTHVRYSHSEDYV